MPSTAVVGREGKRGGRAEEREGRQDQAYSDAQESAFCSSLCLSGPKGQKSSWITSSVLLLL